MKEELVAQVLEKLNAKKEEVELTNNERHDTLALGLDPATRDFIQAQLGSENDTTNENDHDSTLSGAVAAAGVHSANNVAKQNQQLLSSQEIDESRTKVATVAPPNSDINKRGTEDAEQVIQVDLDRVTSTTNTVDGDNDDYSTTRPVKAELMPQRTEITASEPDEESLTHAK